MKNVVLMLGLALLFAIGSGWVEQAAFLDLEGTFVRWSTGVAAKMFTLAAILISMAGTQWQRRQISARLQTVEAELSALRHR